jgi:RNA polymerase sigma-70 factor (ECF subfamily)
VASGPPPQPARKQGGEQEEGKSARLAASGDKSEFWRLIERHHRAIYRLAVALVGKGPEAEDATQETFVRAFESLHRYDAQRPFGPWLRGIAVNVCRQYHQRRGRQGSRQVPLDEAPCERQADAESSEVILDALAQMEERYRLPLVLFYIEQASVEEVAHTLGLREGTVRVRLHRGRERLRRALSEQPGDGAGT